MPSRPRIVVIGSINMDLVVGCDRIPRPGETLRGANLVTFPGGKGANQAVAAARLGAEVHMVSCVGGDTFGKSLRASLKQAGVNTRFVRTTPSVASGTATILVQKDGENSIVISPGTNETIGRADVDAAKSTIERADFVLLQLEIPVATVLHAINLCRRLGIRTMLDPAPVPAKFPAGLYRADILTPNESEAAVILHSPAMISPSATMKQLLSRGATEVALKLGKNGCIYGSNSEQFHIPGFKIRAIDTTAAGDCFNAGLAVGLAEKMNLRAALRFANAAGALACTTSGAQTSLPTRCDVMRLARTEK